MSVVAFRAENFSEPKALAGITHPELSLRLTNWIERSPYARRFSVVSSIDDLSQRAMASMPQLILIEEGVLDGAKLTEAIHLLPASSHLILVAGANRQKEAAPYVARGELDFVLKSEDFFSLAVALIDRRLQAAARPERYPLPPGLESPDDLSSIFRHEINNPLTGILGNAELLLAHRDRLPSTDTQRLQTIVELAVRLRETIRRLTNEWEAGVHSGRAI